MKLVIDMYSQSLSILIRDLSFGSIASIFSKPVAAVGSATITSGLLKDI